MVQFGASPAVWGAAGAAVYAGTRLITALWGGDAEPDQRARTRAVARFLLAVFFGPVAASALTQPIMAAMGKGSTVPAVALAIGLSCNALWPLFVQGLNGEVRKAFGALFKRVGAALNGDGQ